MPGLATISLAATPTAGEHPGAARRKRRDARSTVVLLSNMFSATGINVPGLATIGLAATPTAGEHQGAARRKRLISIYKYTGLIAAAVVAGVWITANATAAAAAAAAAAVAAVAVAAVAANVAGDGGGVVDSRSDSGLISVGRGVGCHGWGGGDGRCGRLVRDVAFVIVEFIVIIN